MTARWLPVLVGAVAVGAIGVWTLAPRFELDTPSLVDDWWSIAQSEDQAAAAVRFGNAEETRYRPAWILWGYGQWHTLDAPRGLAGPNAWNVARLFVLVAGLCLLTALALPPPRSTGEGVVLAGLATLPALLVVTVPGFAVDLARFGPQEPLLVGGMALGGSFLVLAARALLTENDLHRLRTALLALAGVAFWLLGVYQKEASVCVLPLLVAVAIAARARLTAWPSLAPARRTALVAIAAVVLVPLVHVGAETLWIAHKGKLVYDTRLDGGRGALTGSWHLLEVVDEQLSLLGVGVMAGALVAVAAAFVVTRTVNTLALGALLSGLFSLLVAGQAGVVTSRYYLPLFALCAIAFSLALADFGASVRAVCLVLVVALALP